MIAGPCPYTMYICVSHCPTGPNQQPTKCTQTVSTLQVLATLRQLLLSKGTQALPPGSSICAAVGGGLRLSSQPQLASLCMRAPGGSGGAWASPMLTALHLLDCYPFSGSLDWSVLSQLQGLTELALAPGTRLSMCKVGTEALFPHGGHTNITAEFTSCARAAAVTAPAPTLDKQGGRLLGSVCTSCYTCTCVTLPCVT